MVVPAAGGPEASVISSSSAARSRSAVTTPWTWWSISASGSAVVTGPSPSLRGLSSPPPARARDHLGRARVGEQRDLRAAHGEERLEHRFAHRLSQHGTAFHF